MGPVTTPRSLDKAESHIADAKKQGGQIITGGNKLHGTKGYDGYFFEPTIIGKATRQMLVSQEEQFSPILAIFEFDTEDEVVKQANDTSMGLASCKSNGVRFVVDDADDALQISSPRISTERGDYLRTSKLA